MNITSVIIIPTIIYFCIIVIIGIYTKYKGAGDKVDGYFAASRNVRFSYLCTAIMAGLGIWAASYMAAAEGAYIYGVAGLWIYPLYWIGVALPALGAGRLRKLLPYGTTIYQFVKFRYDNKTQVLWLLLFAIFSIMNIVLQITGVGVAFNALSNGIVPYWAGAVIVCVFILIYLMVAGLWQSIISEFVLVVLVVIGLSIIGFSVIGKLGGIDALISAFLNRVSTENVPEMANLFRSDALRDYFVPVLIWATFVIWARQELWQVAFAGNPKVVNRSYVFTGIWWASVPMICGIIGLAGWAFNIDVVHADDIFPKMVSMYVPLGGAILVFLILQGVVSTAGQITVATAAIFVEDLYLGYINPKLKDDSAKAEIKLRFLTITAFVVILIFSGIIALTRMSMLQLLLALNLLLAPVAMPLLLGMFFKAPSANGAFWGSLIGLIAGLFCLFVLDLGTGSSLIIGALLSLIITLVVTAIKPDNFNFDELADKAKPLGIAADEI